MKIKKAAFLIFIAFFAGYLFCLGHKNSSNYQEAKREKLLYGRRESAWKALNQKLKSEINQFKAETGIVIKDLGTGREFVHNEKMLFPSASLAKVPVMAACFLAVQEKKIKLNRSLSLRAKDKLSGSGFLKEARNGSSFTVEELIGLMIYDSDNTATNMLTNLLGLKYLNDSFKKFGLKNTCLSRRIADFALRKKGIENYTTASDIANILEKIYRRTLISKEASEKCLKFLKLQRVNNRIPRYLPLEITVAHKTGLENKVCHDAGIVFTRQGDFLICVLTKHKNSNSFPSAEFIAKISLCVYKYFDES